ncbi:DDE transposase family protein [Chlorogloeopsis sp. ULAP01]|uniref:DDE transposase family protein n=1 Tax=Chlorogloeopsis sp. ULAP01 TaxID=3056483 RepID=UPI0025AB1E1D|nr:DDE transposase family protein [Chlorogloeopsis sp. ULAP01]MDM9381545.1 DDE transposase family protein [Chlorogloeopsis sp. ULAP01]
MGTLQTWHIVKHPTSNCDIVPSHEASGDENSEIVEKWGPFDSQGEAIARRVGLIRSGKCQPI